MEATQSARSEIQNTSVGNTLVAILAGESEISIIATAANPTTNEGNIGGEDTNVNGMATDWNPTENDPLPGVDLSIVPKIFRLKFGAVLHQLRNRITSKKKSNQHEVRTSSSSSFPWPDNEYNWPKPLFKQTKIDGVYHFLPYFARIKVNMPDKCIPHTLTN
jgi:hypothetical protein